MTMRDVRLQAGGIDEVARVMLKEAREDDSKVVGIVVFASDGRNLHTLVSGDGWPDDQERWQILIEALRIAHQEAVEGFTRPPPTKPENSGGEN